MEYIERQVNHAIPEHFEDGDFVINVKSGYSWRLAKGCSSIMNKTSARGVNKEKYHVIFCDSCDREHAKHDYNGIGEYICDSCYKMRLN